MIVHRSSNRLITASATNAGLSDRLRLPTPCCGSAASGTEASLRGGLNLQGDTFCSGLRFVCSDLWQPYLKVLAERADEAIHVLDRFHIRSNSARPSTTFGRRRPKRLRSDGYEPLLTHSRWCLLKRPENLTDRQTVKLKELLKYNLQSVRAYLHREDFSTLLGVPIPRLGRPLPRRVVRALHAFPTGANEEGSPQFAFAPRTLAQLVSGQRPCFGGHRRGF